MLNLSSFAREGFCVFISNSVSIVETNEGNEFRKNQAFACNILTSKEEI